MAAEERWYFTKQQLSDTPNRKCGIDPDRELSYRQQAANFIQDMGQRLQVNQLCINTAIVYMHRFYMFHTFTKFHRNAISTCALFLAAKVEEQPRKLEHVIKVAHICLHREAPPLDTKSEAYLEQAQELVINENIMLQTLGFDVAIDHPHTHVVKCCQLVRGGSTSIHQHHASKDLAQTSYFMATNSLHLTTMCLQYKPTVVACVCILLACKWGNWEIPISSEGRKWFFYVDKTVTQDLLEELTTEFLAILDRCPSRLKRKMMSANTGGEFSEMNCEALTQATTSRSSMSLTINSLGLVNKSDKLGEKNQDRERSSSSRSGSSHKPSAAGSEKNGGVAQDRKERIKKEPHNNSYANAVSNVDSTQQSELASPAKSELVKVANSTDAAAQLSANDGSVKKVRADGSSSKTITPKEYQEYRERSKREKEKVKQIGVTDKSRNTPAASSSAATVAVKQGKTNGIEKETMMQEVIINNTSLSSVNLQPVVSLTHLDLAKFKNAKHFQLSAGSSSNVAKQFVKIDGFPTTDPAFSSTASSMVPGAIPGSFAAVSVKRTPEQETRGGGCNLLSKSTPINPVTNDSISQSVASILGSILTPSPPSAKDGFTFSMDDMAVFTSPSELLVPVTPVEPEPVENPLDSNKMLGLGGKSEHKKQRAAEDLKTNLSSPPLSVSNNFNEANSNLTLSQSEHRRKDKSASKLVVPDMLLDVKPTAFSGVESDFLNSSNTKHNSKIQSTEKLNKHHRVKKSAPSINLSHLSDSLSAGGDSFLPQQDYHMTVTADYLNQNPMFETNSESCRNSGDVHSTDVFSSSSQSSSMLLASAPSSNDANNATLVSLQEKQCHSNHVLHASQQPPSIPIEMMFSTDKQHYETETATLAQLPPSQTSPIVKSEPSESKHSRRSLQSSSKHEKKEKRKKHDKKEKSKEHCKDKERSEEKHVPKVPKLMIPKDVLGSSSNNVKSEAGEPNHKPKDESLVVKIKLGGSKSGKNGNLPEVVSNAPSTVSSETLAVKERSGLKLKFTKNPSSKESYIIGNDQESKTKDKSKDKVKESRKRSRSSTSPKTKDVLIHEVMPTTTIAEAAAISQPPPAKVIKTTVLSKAPKKGAAINNPINVSNSSANNNSPALPKTTGRAVAKNEQTQPNPHNNNMIANEYNRRSQTGHERGRGASGGNKRNSRGNSRVPAAATNPIHLVPPPPPVPGPVPPQMMYHAGIPPPNLYDRRGGVVGGNDAFNPYFAYDQNNFYPHQMPHGFPGENNMFYPPPNMPGLRPPPPPHMGFPPQPQFQQGQGQQRGTRDQFNRQQQQHQRSSGPPLPIQPPPRNPPPPPEN